MDVKFKATGDSKLNDSPGLVVAHEYMNTFICLQVPYNSH